MIDYPVGVKVIVLNQVGDLLTLKRGKDHPTKPHRTDVPGGLIEKGEPEVFAAVRELREETNITVSHKDLELFFADSFTHPFSRKRYTVLCYWVQLDNEPKVQLSYEHESYEWCSPKEFLEKGDLEDIQRKAVEYGIAHELFKA